MANIQKIFSEEIRRQAKKEVKCAVEKLRLQVATLKSQVQEQKNQIQQLTKLAPAETKEEPVQADVNDKDDNSKKVRMTGNRIKKIRLKCKLTQDQLAKLLGVSRFTVVKWELGKFAPREDAKIKLTEVQRMGKTALKKSLQLIEEKANDDSNTQKSSSEK